MSQVLEVSRPTPLRLFGFLFTAVGGLLIALGSLQTWATITVAGDRTGVLDTVIPGVDQAEGKVTLALGVVMLIGVVALRAVASNGARRTVSLLILLSGAASLAIGIVDAASPVSRFADATAGGLIEVSRGIGLWLVVAGGAIGVIGGLLDLAWVGRQRLAAADVGVDPAE